MHVAIFDLDDVLIHEGFDPPVVCEQTISALEYLQAQEVTCVLASYNADAQRLLKEGDLLRYFSVVRGEEDTGDAKREQLTYYRKLYPGARLHFFDDLEVNIATAHLLAITATVVDYQCGLLLGQVQSAFPR